MLEEHCFAFGETKDVFHGVVHQGNVLVNQDGVRSNPVRARVTQRIRGDCVYMVHGYGHSAKGMRFARGRGASDTELVTRFKTDPIMGGTGMNVNFVRIEAADSAARKSA